MTFEQVKEFGWTGKMPPEDVEPTMRRWTECVRTGRDWEGEMRFPSPDGRWHTILSRGKPVRDAQGQIKAWVGINLDITERKRAEARLTADLAALTRMHALSGRLLEAERTRTAAAGNHGRGRRHHGGRTGTLQLLEGDSLRIVAHHGHQQPFLEFFAAAENRASVCGEALKRGERVVVPDVEESSLFAGTPSLAVLREAGVRAVQSTPMVSRTGALLGILTTQWGVPHSPDEHDLWRIDLLARQASDLIESAKAEAALRESEERELRRRGGTWRRSSMRRRHPCSSCMNA